MADDSRPKDEPDGPQQERPLRHPIRAAEEEVARLHEIAARGESTATPVILIGTWIAAVLPLIAIVIALAFGVAYLVTRGDDGSSTAPGAGHGVGHAGETPPAKTQSSVAAGRTVFSENCSSCHGVTGRGGNGGPDLTAIPSARNRARVIRQVTNGGGGMPPFRGTLSQRQIDDVAAYVTKVVTKR